MAADFHHPTHECDLVMKGGITSGVVYPPAILKLAQTYRFRAIGGTSAGAIAAAATAAAEFGRESETGGFQRFAALSRQLGEEQFLFNLLQPAQATRPLMNSLLAFVSEWKQNRSWKLPRAGLRLTQTLLADKPAAFAEGALWGTGLASAVFLLMGGSLKGWRLLAPLFVGWLGGLAKGGYDLSRPLLDKEELKNNFFGICMGIRDASTSAGSEVLTEWLSASINELAGRDKDDSPLTFGELRKKQVGSRRVGIQLQMVTTNLSQGRPYVAPFDTNTFLFDEREMRALFPRNVVDYMVAHAYTTRRVSLEKLPGYHFLPQREELPVIVGMRMSLAFPLLISAVPLHTIRHSPDKHGKRGKAIELTQDDLQLNWFSDGGICSNFPIHFFDAWLPRRPTFGINLVSQPEEIFASSQREILPTYQSIGDVEALDADDHTSSEAIAEAVYLPRASHPLTPDWREVEGIMGFARAIVFAAQNYRDTMQSVLPSYRERIVQIRFGPNEGGLNLAMDHKTIETIQRKGEHAGQVLLDSFKFSHHQWVRFQVLMALIERQLKDLEGALQLTYYQKLMQDQLARQKDTNKDERYPYPRSQDWCDEAVKRVEALLDLIQRLNTEARLVEDPPKPRPVLRVTPEL